MTVNVGAQLYFYRRVGMNTLYKKHKNFSILFLVVVFISALIIIGKAAENEKILPQLLQSVENSTNEISAHTLAKIAVVGGQTLHFETIGLKDNGNDEILSFINECYARATKSGQMRNLMACYIADYQISMMRERLNKKLKLVNLSNDRLQKTLNTLGINDKNIIASFKSQALSSQQEADSWVSSHTVDFYLGCVENGVGSAQCK